MIEKWSAEMKAYGMAVGRTRVNDLAEKLTTGLTDDLPDHVQARQDGDDVIISGPDLSSELEDNSSLRDIGFLLQGVR
ncbi:hypothetical protein SAMN02745824_0157 [Parasphingorhabdus marina DSM 22363]|uniref:Uncharacterized protein n=1 Tax=Parasphingorhabdus marina DSM 22363 TaxID=1123272 RepID=A0A1N6CM27_9SPHN|nr:hypothetical protein [Parasphingorhabdus marina]SIN59628.1 hypothetical protein SAMN02745824_0157 [Parasphingorhabdus marina DSM 22363]